MRVDQAPTKLIQDDIVCHELCILMDDVNDVCFVLIWIKFSHLRFFYPHKCKSSSTLYGSYPLIFYFKRNSHLYYLNMTEASTFLTQLICVSPKYRFISKYFFCFLMNIFLIC